MPDYDDPVVIARTKSNLSDFCNRIHRVIIIFDDNKLFYNSILFNLLANVKII
jgi:ribosome-interacting GTPase 1